jgi:hypothetical protein
MLRQLGIYVMTEFERHWGAEDVAYSKLRQPTWALQKNQDHFIAIWLYVVRSFSARIHILID